MGTGFALKCLLSSISRSFAAVSALRRCTASSCRLNPKPENAPENLSLRSSQSNTTSNTPLTPPVLHSFYVATLFMAIRYGHVHVHVCIHIRSATLCAHFRLCSRKGAAAVVGFGDGLAGICIDPQCRVNVTSPRMAGNGPHATLTPRFVYSCTSSCHSSARELNAC